MVAQPVSCATITSGATCGKRINSGGSHLESHPPTFPPLLLSHISRPPPPTPASDVLLLSLSHPASLQIWSLRSGVQHSLILPALELQIWSLSLSHSSNFPLFQPATSSRRSFIERMLKELFIYRYIYIYMYIYIYVYIYIYILEVQIWKPFTENR
jgi:hypothetical protein